VPYNGAVSLTARQTRTPAADAASAAARRLDVDDVDEAVTAGQRQFDEESFSEVLTYYGSASNIQVRQRLITDYSCDQQWCPEQDAVLYP